MINGKKIGFSFSGGGSRAAAQIGIIKALNELNIKADHVTGTSGGAIIATLYAAGLPVEKMIEFAAKGSLFRLFKVGLPIKGLTSLDYLEELLQTYLDVRTFEALDIPLSIVASNLLRGEKEIFNSGTLLNAVSASCAIPLVFKPVKINDQLYADGGILDNMPVSPLQETCDLIFGFNVMPNAEISSKDLENMLSIGMRVFAMAASNSSQVNFPACDLVIEPQGVLNYNIFNFKSSEELVKIGYESVLERKKEIIELVAR